MNIRQLIKIIINIHSCYSKDAMDI